MESRTVRNINIKERVGQSVSVFLKKTSKVFFSFCDGHPFTLLTFYKRCRYSHEGHIMGKVDVL